MNEIYGAIFTKHIFLFTIFFVICLLESYWLNKTITDALLTLGIKLNKEDGKKWRLVFLCIATSIFTLHSFLALFANLYW